MQSNACDCNRWLCALPQVNMIVNDAILCLWSNLWKIVKLTGLSMILASYYSINLLRFARTKCRTSEETVRIVTFCLCENKTEIRVRLTSWPRYHPNNSVTYRAPEPAHWSVGYLGTNMRGGHAPHGLSLKVIFKAWSEATTHHYRPNMFGGAFNGSPTINVQRHWEINWLRMMDNSLGYEKGKWSSLFYASYHGIQMFTQLPRPS